MFIDETEITVSSGRGGDGLVSFRREKFVPRGGPDGGDGGDGGEVVLRSSVHLNTLAGLQHRRQYRAGNGQPGGANNRTGRDGQSLLIEVPVGTLVLDRERGHVLRDLSAAGVEFVVVSGGRGGKGNKHFAHSTNQTPRRATQGQLGQVRELRLELRLVADVGLVGLPNAGKSTFLSRVSAARPKVADYPFTTLEPMLGIVHRDQFGMVIADIPGLIEGAHEGVGLGDRFLRHVARTRVLLQLVDASEGAEAAIAAWRTVRSELALSGLSLETKAVVVALSRSDTVEDPGAIARALEAAAGVPVCVLSAHTGLGVADVLGRLARLLEDVPRAQLPAREAPPESPAVGADATTPLVTSGPAASASSGPVNADVGPRPESTGSVTLAGVAAPKATTSRQVATSSSEDVPRRRKVGRSGDHAKASVGKSATRTADKKTPRSTLKHAAHRNAASNARARKSAVRSAPAAKSPTKVQPTASKSAAGKSAASKPAARKPAARKPAARKPTTRKPTTRKPTTKKPTTKKPTTRKPTTRKPTSGKSTAGKRAEVPPPVTPAGAKKGTKGHAAKPTSKTAGTTAAARAPKRASDPTARTTGKVGTGVAGRTSRRATKRGKGSAVRRTR